MPAPRSSSPSGRIAILAAVALLGLSACGGGRVWRIPIDELLAHLHSGDHELLRQIDYRSVDAREATRLGPDAPYYLSLIFRNLSMPEMERRMVELARRSAAGVVGQESEIAALEILLDAGELAEVLRRTRAAVRRIEEGTRAARVRRIRLDALWGMRRDRELLELLAVHVARPSAGVGQERDDARIVLYGAVAAARLGRPGWDDMFRDLAWNYRSSDAHGQALAFLAADARRLERFDSAERKLLEGKVALAERRYSEAVELLGPALARLVAPAGSVVAEEIGRALLSLGRAEDGVELLRAIQPHAAEPWFVEELVGRQLAGSGRPAEAALALERAVRMSPDARQRQRALRQFAALRIDSGERKLGTLFASRREYVIDGSYFAELLERAVTILLQDGAWSELETLGRFCAQTGASQTLARIDFLLSRAVTGGLLPFAPSRDPDALLDEAIAADPSGYYGLLAGSLRGRPFPRLDYAGRPEAARPSSTLPRLRDAEAYVAGFFRYGLPLEGYRAIVALGEEVGPASVADAARELQRSGHNAESIRLASRLGRLRDLRLDRPELLLWYPALYVGEVQRIAGEHDLPVRVVLGLIREESAFDPDVVSQAGAVGLTQLMPATAEEISARQRQSVPDLTDPQANLRLGLRHLAGLRASTGSMARAVIAYNAGLGRLRSWERQYGGLPEELFAETIPFAETRLYMRQVLLAAVMYGALYEGASPEATIALIFPALGA